VSAISVCCWFCVKNICDLLAILDPINPWDVW
jgi:hypothetical protein